MNTTTNTKPPAHTVRVETIDGGVYSGATLAEAMDALRASAWGMPECRTLKQYMSNIAARCADWNKQTVRVDTLDNFVNDLALIGLLRVVHDVPAEVVS